MNLRNVIASADGTKHTLVTIDPGAVLVDVTVGIDGSFSIIETNAGNESQASLLPVEAVAVALDFPAGKWLVKNLVTELDGQHYNIPDTHMTADAGSMVRVNYLLAGSHRRHMQYSLMA